MVVAPWMLIVAVFILFGSLRGARRRERWMLRGGNGMSGWFNSQITGGDAESEALKAQFAQALASRDEQMEEMQRRLYDLEERLDFTERLLAQRSTAETTPPPH